MCDIIASHQYVVVDDGADVDYYCRLYYCTVIRAIIITMYHSVVCVVVELYIMLVSAVFYMWFTLWLSLQSCFRFFEDFSTLCPQTRDWIGVSHRPTVVR